MKCFSCRHYNRYTQTCLKWKTKVKNPYIETDCKFYTNKPVKPNSTRYAFGGTEFRNKEGYEVVGGLIHTSPYWYSENKKRSSKKTKPTQKKGTKQSK